MMLIVPCYFKYLDNTKQKTVQHAKCSLLDKSPKMTVIVFFCLGYLN